jgi:hypothetical protein
VVFPDSYGGFWNTTEFAGFFFPASFLKKCGKSSFFTAFLLRKGESCVILCIWKIIDFMYGRMKYYGRTEEYS